MANPLITNLGGKKLLLGENTTQTGTYTNGTGALVTLAEGTVMGRISASGKLTPFTSGASDGSQYVVGVLIDAYTVDDTASAVVTICDGGEVNENAIVLSDSDTLETVVSGRRIKDKIAAESVGLKLIPSIEMSATDNQ